MVMGAKLAPEFRAAATSGSDAAGAGTVVITNPTAVNGDLILMGITGRNVAPVTTLAGWTNILTSTIAAGQNLYLYTKIANSLPSTETWTVDSRKCSAFTASFSNASVDVVGVVTGDADMSSYTAAGITATASGLLLCIAQIDNNSLFTPPSGMTERVDYAFSGSGSNTITLCTQVISAGATGTRTGTSSTANIGSSVLVSLK
jgi:hypothetical protein